MPNPNIRQYPTPKPPESVDEYHLQLAQEEPKVTIKKAESEEKDD
jgi:hypothetical protein